MSADKKNKYKSAALKLCAAGLTVVMAGLGYLCLTPKTYRAVAKVKLLKTAWNGAADANASFGPDKLPGECQTVRSDAILDQAITNLGLNVLWGKQVSQGAPLSAEQTRERLKAMLDVQPALKASGAIEIAATGGDPVELAKIVNQITKLYCDLRQAGRDQASRQGVNALRAQWEAQGEKVQAAQAALDKLAYTFNMDRATNPVQVFDPGAVQSLQSQRALLEDTYRKQSNQLARLKSLSRDELKKVLSANDADTNSLLAGALQQLAEAKSNLRDAQAAHGPEAPETKSAVLAVEQLNRRIDGLLDSALSVREFELSSLKATLEQIQALAEKAAHLTNDSARFAEQDATFAKAQKNLRKLMEERDSLENEIIGNGSMAAVMPDVITARIVELADPPVKPESPDGRIALGAFIAGVVAAGSGLLLLVLLGLKPRGAEKKSG